MATNSSYESKLTVNIDTDLYNTVMNHFHYGQRTIFFNKIFSSIEKLLAEDKFNQLTDYMYNKTDLTLPGI